MTSASGAAARMADGRARRIRRAPEEAREEILRAARAIVRDEGYGALNVDRVMQRTGMTRSSFYHYFRNVEDLIVGVFEPIESEMIEAVEPWLSPEAMLHPAETIRRSLGDVVGVVDRHRSLAAVGVARHHGEAWERWQVRVVDLFVEKTADYIRSLQKSGATRVADADDVARALILMNNAALLDWARKTDPGPPEALARVLSTIWTGALLAPPTWSRRG